MLVIRIRTGKYIQIMRRVCITIVAVHKQEALHILSVCVCVCVYSLSYPACKARAPYFFFFLSSAASLAVPYFFPHYFMKEKIFGGEGEL